MNEDRIPSLFEILNRFSKPPLDLWSFYVFLKEQYGGVEYLEFWLDCANYSALNKEYFQSTLREHRASHHSGHSHGRTSSPASSILFDMLREDALDASPVAQIHSHDEEHDDFELGSLPVRFSTVSDERARNKRDTVSRLSEILENMRASDLGSTAVPSSRYARVPHAEEPEQYSSADGPSSLNPNHARSASGIDSNDGMNAHISSGVNTEKANVNRGPAEAIASGQRPHSASSSIKRRTIRDTAQRIIETYLTPKSPKEIELPSDQLGWSMADDIRQVAALPGGLENPKLFENATTYVFEALEREALPPFLIARALSNVQPVSGTIRLIGGLLALFGAFWVSFVFILLNWKPTSHRCWVILPFGVGWYLTLSALYRMDPILAFSGTCEADGGGIIKVQEHFVQKIMLRRGLFVALAIILITAAFSVLFIFVPGHHL